MKTIFTKETEYQDLEVELTCNDTVIVQVYQGCEANNVEMSIADAREMARKILEATKDVH